MKVSLQISFGRVAAAVACCSFLGLSEARDFDANNWHGLSKRQLHHRHLADHQQHDAGVENQNDASKGAVELAPDWPDHEDAAGLHETIIGTREAIVEKEGFVADEGKRVADKTNAGFKEHKRGDSDAYAGAVIAQMFQWSWDSVASECVSFIGPAGYKYVQGVFVHRSFESYVFVDLVCVLQSAQLKSRYKGRSGGRIISPCRIKFRISMGRSPNSRTWSMHASLLVLASWQIVSQASSSSVVA